MTQLYVCPACAGLFTQGDIDRAGSMFHCLDCDHHYPSNDGHCHNCKSQNIVQVAITDLTMDDYERLDEWHKSRNYPSGMGELYLPNGRVYRGGVRVK